MTLPQPITAAELAKQSGAELVGDGTAIVTGLNEIHHVEPGDLCFVDHPRYYAKTLASAATVIIIDRRYDCPAGKALLVHPEPFALYNRLVWQARPQVQWNGSVHPSASIGPGTQIAPGAVVGPEARIGADCQIGPNAVIGDGCTIGDRVRIGAGTVIGGEAFYFKRTAEQLIPWRSGGAVAVHDDVEIGPCCTIARGVSSVTTIGRGTKIDAQVQIGHDCKIGAHCLMAAQVGIAGNCTVGDWSVLQGQAGVAQNITMGARTTVLAQSGIGNDLEGGKAYFGSPAQEARKAFRDMVNLRSMRERGGVDDKSEGKE